ncbi:MAG: pyridoxamine 5-phosphate oxidase-related, FMN-binding protein [Actinomycetia bacterium]|nr:pyridoxamine 5-phosphate oxidase-related, FMN-binding protein [Actinomycetes bacterium]
MRTHAPTGRTSVIGASTVLLTTYRRTGDAVSTPVNIAWDGDRGAFHTWDAAGKLGRMWRNPHVTVAPCTLRGRVTGPTVAARARILGGDEADRARELLGRRWPLVHGHLIPWCHRRKGWTTVHLELTLA